MKTYTEYFKRGTRTCGDEYFFLTDDAPIKLKDLIRFIHEEGFFGCMPNDWIYKTIYEAFRDLEEDKLEDLHFEADIWDYQLIDWLKQSAYAAEFCDDVINSANDFNTIFKIISLGQKGAKEVIYLSVNDWINEQQTENKNEK